MNFEEIENLESISSFYEHGDRMDELLVEREVELVRRYSVVRTNALEVGCGNGYSTERFVTMFDELEVLEPSYKNVVLMQRRRLQTEIVCHNVLLEEFQSSRKFDNVLFLNVLEHVLDPIAALRKLGTLVRDEGFIYISAPNCMSLNRRAGYRMGLLDGYDQMAPKDLALGHRRLYTVEMMRAHCIQAGLRVVTMKGVYMKPLSEKQMIELGEPAIRAFHSLGEDVPEYCANVFAVATKKDY